MDIIIGPLYAKNFNILCKKYGNDKGKIIINLRSISLPFIDDSQKQRERNNSSPQHPTKIETFIFIL